MAACYGRPLGLLSARQCVVQRFFYVQNVERQKCPRTKMSNAKIVKNVQRQKCPMTNMSKMSNDKNVQHKNVQRQKCPATKMSKDKNVQ
jgi:hypothetical protein